MKLLILDPGHGGDEPGAAAFGYTEKDLNLVVSKRVAELLKEYSPELTRTADIDVSLAQRAVLIKDKYRYCLSIHLNAFDGTARGVETIHSIYSEQGKRLAQSIAQNISYHTGIPIRRVFSREGSNGDYYAMHRNTGSTTTIIVESLFLDNPSDIKALNIESIAQGIAAGFRAFLGQQGHSAEYKKVSITGRDRYPTLRRGDKGPDVVVLQEQLQDMSFYVGAIDGDFGPKTDDAVRWLQRVNRLDVDGTVGPATWDSILFAHVYSVDPMSLRNEVAKLPGNQINGDFMNSIFFDMATMTALGNMVQDGKVLAKQMIYKNGQQHDYVKRGNLIVYQDGSVEVKMIMDIEKEEDVSKIRFAVSGFNLDPLDLKAEWWPADIGRTTWRTMLGYDGKHIKAVVMPNCSAERGKGMLDMLGCSLKLGLDSGDSTNARFAGKDIRLTNRRLYGIIKFG